MKKSISTICAFVALAGGLAVQPLSAQIQNPVFEGWYADPEGIVYGNRYWVFPTTSWLEGDELTDAYRADWSRRTRAGNTDYNLQTHFDAFSSRDLIHWRRHREVLHIRDVEWAEFAMWAPSVIHANGKYYFFFGANDVHEGEVGGIGVSTARRPQGPYKDALGKPLIGNIVNGAQPIDQYVFHDPVSGEYYMYYGGWGHCNMVHLASDLLSLVPFPDGDMFKEVTPEGYVEGPFMLYRDGHYYFMWSEGGWTGPNYSVAYAISDTPFGPFERVGKILQQDPAVAVGAGHHSVIKDKKSDDYYIVYHRRPLELTGGSMRHVCIDTLRFRADGTIEPVRMTAADGTLPYVPNPVWGPDWPDPTLWRADDGLLYSMATMGEGIRPLICSTDGAEWQKTDILPFDSLTYTKIHTYGKMLWAPDVTVVGGQRMAYVTIYNSAEDASIVALRETTPGHFEFASVLTRGIETGIADTIDPEVVTDPRTGQVWLFFGSVGGVHRVCLTADGLALAPGATYEHVAGLTVKENPARDKVFEGTYLYQRKGWWYMFVSAGHYNDGSYRICVGRSRTLDGTFLDREGRPLLEGNATAVVRSGGRDRLFGPGHNGEIITDAEGRTWMYYHCHVRNIREGRTRPMMRQQILWTSDGWPYFSGGKPAQ